MTSRFVDAPPLYATIASCSASSASFAARCDRSSAASASRTFWLAARRSEFACFTIASARDREARAVASRSS